jgi:hypothetical protein
MNLENYELLKQFDSIGVSHKKVGRHSLLLKEVSRSGLAK